MAGPLHRRLRVRDRCGYSRKRVELRRDPDPNGRGLVRIPGGTIRRPRRADTRWVALRVQARHLRHIACPDAACHPDLKGLSVGFRRPEVPTRTRWQSICTMSVAGLRHLASEYDKITRTELLCEGRL